MVGLRHFQTLIATRRHSGRKPDSSRLTDANGTILAIVPIRDWKR
jgi:hypothetical protein